MQTNYKFTLPYVCYTQKPASAAAAATAREEKKILRMKLHVVENACDAKKKERKNKRE